MNLSRTIGRSAGLWKKLLPTSECHKTFCSDQSDKNHTFKRGSISSEYFDAYERVYEHSGLFQNPGVIRNQQLANDFANLQKQDLKMNEKEPLESIETPEKSEEYLESQKYYDMYYKLFFTNSDETGLTEEPESSETNYYDEYRKIFQEPETLFSRPKSTENLTHTTKEGHLKMVDVGGKPDSKRFAKASGKVYLGEKAFSLVKENKLKKGDILNTAKIAGIMACKNTSQLIPLCHPLAISNINMDMTLNETEWSVCIECGVQTTGKTGVEMEALTGVSVAALTVYDMCKAVSHDIEISNIQLLEKYGGVSGNYTKN